MCVHNSTNIEYRQAFARAIQADSLSIANPTYTIPGTLNLSNYHTICLHVYVATWLIIIFITKLLKLGNMIQESVA